MGRSRMIDAHLHVWDLTVSDYSWLTPDRGVLYDSFLAETAAQELHRTNFDGCVLVQAEDSLVDTRYMLEVAGRLPIFCGVVGWIPLDDPVAAAQVLDELGDNPALCGIRHLVDDDPRDDFLDLPGVRRSLGKVAERGLAFDVQDAWPRHLGAARRLAADLPNLTVVIDHLAKPPMGRSDFAAWRAELARVAALPNTVAKFSGLHLPGVAFTPEGLAPLWDIALNLFGPERLMYGSDWPISVPYGGYQPTWSVLSTLFASLTEAERAQLVGGTAVRTYALGSPRTQDPHPLDERTLPA
jgi:L-fuconolactonase